MKRIKGSHRNTLLFTALLAIFFAPGLFAQDVNNQEFNDQQADDSAAVEPEPTPAAPTPPATTSTRNAVVNLQTTVTGNQEQPRVLYILPWQSPETEAIDFELLDADQSAVFGHVERDELRRQLESAGQFD